MYPAAFSQLWCKASATKWYLPCAGSLKTRPSPGGHPSSFLPESRPQQYWAQWPAELKHAAPQSLHTQLSRLFPFLITKSCIQRGLPVISMPLYVKDFQAVLPLDTGVLSFSSLTRNQSHIWGHIKGHFETTTIYGGQILRKGVIFQSWK